MKTRIISGAVGVILIGAVLYFHNTVVLPVAVAAMIAVMLYELIRAVKLEKNIPILVSAEICGVLTPFICYYKCNTPYDVTRTVNAGDLADLFMFTLVLAAAFVIFITWLRNHKKIRYEQVFFVLASMILVPQSMTTMLRLECTGENGLFLLIMGLCGAWIADTGAYFTGVTLGKHKLCPEISPKKTVEGLVGGIVTTGLVYSIAFSVYDSTFEPLYFIAGAVCAVIGTVGDLSASMVKRQIGFKDYGKIMPGHGGLMDRFDSVLFVLPTFYVFSEFISGHH